MEYLSIAKGRPNPLFPALWRLRITSADDLSLFIAFQGLPSINVLEIDLGHGHPGQDSQPEVQNVIALLSAAADHALNLTTLCLVSPVNDEIIDTISQVSSVTRLILSTDPTVTGEAFLALDHFASLKKLVLTQEDPSTPILDCSSPRLFSLRDLEVTAPGIEQFRVAASISARSLKTLKLHVISHYVPAQLILVPPAITIHARTNPNLTFISVFCAKNIPLGSVESFREDYRYTSTKSFVKSLTSLRNLTTLSIEHVPFFSVSIVIDMLKALTRMPQLENFKFIPEAISSLRSDQLTLPSLGLLENISRYSPRIVKLSVLMDVVDIPPLPRNYVSTHRMALLELTPSAHIEAVPGFALDQTLDLARYLDRLFPHLQPLSPSWPQGSEAWKGWSGVDKVISSYQEVRALVSPSMHTTSTSNYL
jgi:hypothetical protein